MQDRAYRSSRLTWPAARFSVAVLMAVAALVGFCGAATAQQYLRLGLVDEMEIHVVPALLGAGERLFENLDGPPSYLKPLEVLSSPRAARALPRALFTST